MAGAGGTSAPGGAPGGTPGTGGGEGGNPGTGGTTAPVGTGGVGMAGAGGTSAVVSETVGTTSNGAGGAVGGQDSARVVKLASKSGCSCSLGATPSRASAGYLVAMLACLVLHRRRRLSMASEASRPRTLKRDPQMQTKIPGNPDRDS
jgi:MYXO-CTERM domain-containing protein